MSDTQHTDGERDETRSEREDLPGDDEFEPVEVFGGDDLDLRTGSDDCYKCSVCDTECPVAEVDDDFPGPKFQGPEQWRLKRKGDTDIDSSVMSCSNCMRCDGACPSGVPLSQMHNTARAAYVDESTSKRSRAYWRNRLLANYGTMARFGSMVPRFTTFLLNSTPVKWVNEKLLGITAERDFPAFAEQTFREWWVERGGNHVDSEDKRVAYFHGDYANHNTPEVGKALVRVYESFGYEVAVPEQRCSGTPMFANGMLEDARRAAKVNVRELGALVEEGYDVVASCTSCSMALRQEYPELFDIDGIDGVSDNTYDAMEYLRIHEDLDVALAEAAVDGRTGAGEDSAGYPTERDALDGPFAYHAPCHARNQGLAGQPVELFAALDGTDVEDVGPSCSGISGTYGWKAEKYDVSMEIGEEMFEHMEAADGETGLTECPTCAMQMEHGTGYDVRHPLEVVAAALVE
jgi:glycerol-3-phosphate dehydrogenase subunit C